MLNVIYLRYVPVLMVALLLTSCDYYQRSTLPEELSLGRVLHESEETYWVGPSGLDKIFTVYSMSEDAATKISHAGLPYLNVLPSTHDPKRGKKILAEPPFLKWYATPIILDKKWKRGHFRLKKQHKTPSLEMFYGDSDFIATIPSEIQEVFNQVATSPGGFYSYGGHRHNGVAIVSPSIKKVFYLYQ